MEELETPSLSALLEKISERYPDDKDVLEAMSLAEEEGVEGEEEFDLDFPGGDMTEGEGPGVEDGGASPLDIDALLSEDMEEEEEDEEGITPPSNILGKI